MNLHTLLPSTLPVLGLLLAVTPALHAQATGVPIFETQEYQQTGPSTVTGPSYNFDARIFETTSGDATNATLTYPGPSSPGTYTQTSYSTTTLDYYSGSFASQADLDTAYPTGDYTTNYTDTGGNAQLVSVNFTQTAFDNAVPAFTADTYNAMQSLDPTQGFTFNFNSDAPSAASDSNLVYFTISDSNGVVFNANGMGLPAGTTSIFIPANTFMPLTAYSTDLNFSDRITSNDNGIDTTLGFDQRTSSSFTTSAAVPEASTTMSLGLLLALGLGGAFMAARKKKAA